MCRLGATVLQPPVLCPVASAVGRSGALSTGNLLLLL